MPNDTPTPKEPPQNTTGAAPFVPTGDGSPVDLDYELVRLIGQGGYGEVWLVRDKAGEYRACKVVYRQSFNHDRPYEREYDGIRKFEPVSHASSSQVKILHVGRRDAAGCFYYIMELADDVRGDVLFDPASYVPKTVKSELERCGRLTAAESIQIGLSLSAALENLHEQSLIHRDIKPANIIFIKGVPKLADIGLVTDADVTVSYVGTSGFIPPEGPGSPRADVYGLGKVLYEISTGKDRLQYPELPVDLGELPDRELLLELNSIITKACEANPRKRYASARELHTDLALLADGKSMRQIQSFRRKRSFAALALCVLALALLVAAGGAYFLKRAHTLVEGLPPTTQLPQIPVPDAARVAQNEAKIRENYRLQLAGASDAAKQQAAVELTKQAAVTQDPALQLAYLRVAALLSVEAGDVSQAMEIAKRMEQRFQTNGLSARADLLAEAGSHARTPGKKADLVGFCLRTGFEAIAVDDYSGGAKLAALAKTVAHKGNWPQLQLESEFLLSENQRCQDAFKGVEQYKEILQYKPADPAACFAMGKFLCFVKNDWDTGLPLMARSNQDAPLKAALDAEINERPKMADKQFVLSSLWRNLSDSATGDDKLFYLGRARYWFLKGMTSSDEADRPRLEQELNEWAKAIRTEPAELHIRSRLDGTEVIDVYSDEIRVKVGRASLNVNINQVQLTDLKPGDLVLIKNTGASRLLPDAVDFSTARLVLDQKARKQDHVKIETSPDHVRVVLSRPRPGFYDFRVTLIFGGQP
jgi:hypothetical protein